MKPREPRRKVLIRARLRAGAAWADACILNISSRGLGLQASSPPPIGTYVELCRGRHVIVARVAWVKFHRFGVRTQDRLEVDALVEESAEPAQRSVDVPAVAAVERRTALRVQQLRHERSRQAGRAMEFVSMIALGLLAALLAAGSVGQALAGTLASITTALHGPGVAS